ncbi:cGMP-specific 3',5'-cyclic phosphodiesterase isoform X1 [Adelges cooleyi]|uniref:cGMP-specific 3',5'-cyclic phosphodiesterase isoform X1 n=1 Tax=Adelges cooleyi TaxID=133065 RepID=UPI0021802535|nr:cGMP-specific 3',5'-cyclic phosphodiesterase isoform X1 [Adelges cooleyi]XP_050437391.1 cGMP-specific 3',5'-cyclic phosphodiesterase isoform X1 [Adelges cooleyi]XP_050437392.1 cGMP-specific 3',5'-cyclic phosphodiesterase isoform X1 [Adelges cooleyi]
MDLDADEVERWLCERAPQDLVERVVRARLQHRAGSLSVGRAKRASMTSEMFNTWLASSPIKRAKSPNRATRSSGEWRHHLGLLDEGELFMELIRDVSNELDIDVLCHKILVNVGLLTRADRGSLFLVRGKQLVAKLFDVTVDTELTDAVHKAKTEEIQIPFGVGVAGTVAETKQVVNIKNAYQDPRFNREIDHRTGYTTNLILCVPICNYDNDVIGVAQIINKTDGSNSFTEHDVEIFQRYLTFCAIGIQNAQLFEKSIQEFQRNQMLLGLARSIFEEQNNLDCLVSKIMTQARDLIKCERCVVFLLDLECEEASHLEHFGAKPGNHSIEKNLSNKKSTDTLAEDGPPFSRPQKEIKFTTAFELDREHGVKKMNKNVKPSKLLQIAHGVANSVQVSNIPDVQLWANSLDRQRSVESDDGIDVNEPSIKAILCMPILNGKKEVIGVAQLINKETGTPFTECDVATFEAFAIFCGLGIHNTQMYESACKLMAKQKVALECLSYHATASVDDTIKLAQDTIPSAETYNLYSFKFIDFDLTDDDTCKATIRMFLQCNLVQQFQIPYHVLCKWVLSVRKNYRPVKYHNWRHALNVAQTMFAMLKTGKMERFMSDLEILGLLVACLCHDLDHRGTNNAFQTKTESPLAILYTTSTMEHHHFDQCVMILNSDGNNIFQALSPEDYRSVMKLVENSILSTDLAMYFKKKSRFMEVVENGEFDWQSEEKKALLCGILMTACDVSAIAKPWEVQHKMAKLVADEFFDQGDLEKLQLNQQPVAMMDREKKDELPQMQVEFIDVICLPLYKVLCDTFPWITPLYEGTLENRKHWKDLAEKVEMGLTWIDHDKIEIPVEEFFTHRPSTKDIEFTVTTLNKTQNSTKKANTKSLDLNIDTTTFQRNGAKFSSYRKKPTTSRSFRNRVSRSLYNSSGGGGGGGGGDTGGGGGSTLEPSADSGHTPVADGRPQMISSASLPAFTSPASTPGYTKPPASTPVTATPVKNKNKYCQVL